MATQSPTGPEQDAALPNEDADKSFPRKERHWFKEGDQGKEPDTSEFAPDPVAEDQPGKAPNICQDIWKNGPGPNEHEPGLGLVEPFIDLGSGFGRK
jgi:hypothetical protein